MIQKQPIQERRSRTFDVNRDKSQFDHHVLDIARVVRVVKGGRRFRFRASVVVGDHSGRVGFGIGKSRDVQSAIQKAQAQGEKRIMTIPIIEGTIPHTVKAKFKGAEIQLRPARAGTGVIAGDVIRVVADMVGIRDLVSKAYGSSNKMSNVMATLKALQSFHPKKKEAKDNKKNKQ